MFRRVLFSYLLNWFKCCILTLISIFSFDFDELKLKLFSLSSRVNHALHVRQVPAKTLLLISFCAKISISPMSRDSHFPPKQPIKSWYNFLFHRGKMRARNARLRWSLWLSYWRIHQGTWRWNARLCNNVCWHRCRSRLSPLSDLGRNSTPKLSSKNERQWRHLVEKLLENRWTNGAGTESVVDALRIHIDTIRTKVETSHWPSGTMA